MSELILPEFDYVMDAALWIRENGNASLTNQTFKEILSDLMKRPVREEEYIRAKVLSCPPSYSETGYLTVEEKEELDVVCHEHDRLIQTVSYTISEQGIFVRFARPPGIFDTLSKLFEDGD